MQLQQYQPKYLTSTAKAYIDAWLPEGDNWPQEWAEIFVEHMYHHQPDLFFIAVEDEKVVGGIWGVIKPFVNIYQLVETEIFIIPEYQGKKLSLKLFEKILIESINKYNIKDIEGIADSRKEFPMKYYNSLGQTEIGWTVIVGEALVVLRNVQKRLNKNSNNSDAI